MTNMIQFSNEENEYHMLNEWDGEFCEKKIVNICKNKDKENELFSL